MDCTGERYIPEIGGDWTLEHVHRYLFACEFAKGKAVLDIASGDGYGSQMLADKARVVVGVDISFETLGSAVVKYARKNLFFTQGDATAIPLADKSVDIVTSFETIEHLYEHEKMLQEMKRTLRDNGILIISSPDKYEYSDRTGYVNQYHVNELYRDEFINLLKNNFKYICMFGQRIVFGSVIGAENKEGGFISWRNKEIESRKQGLIDAEYLIALASDYPLPSFPSSFLKAPLEESDRVCRLKGELNDAWVRLNYFSSWEQEARAYIKQLENEKYDVQKELELTYNSRSWRITAPLRSAAAGVRSIVDRQNINKIIIKNEHVVDEDRKDVWPPDVHALEKKIILKQNSPPSTTSLGIFIHIFYVDLIDDILECIDHLPKTSRIHISTDTEDKKDIIIKVFDKRGFSFRTEVRVCPNVGWDIAPFLIGFSDKILNYPLILRLHTKKSQQICGNVGRTWRELLFNVLVGSEERVNAIMRAFDEDQTLGMVCPPIIDYYAHHVDFGKNFPLMQYLLFRYNIQIQPDTPIDFPMGSMFWCRPKVLSPWLGRNFSYADFTPMTENTRDSSLAHALERLFFFGCGITGFSWARLQAISAT